MQCALAARFNAGWAADGPANLLRRAKTAAAPARHLSNNRYGLLGPCSNCSRACSDRSRQIASSSASQQPLHSAFCAAVPAGRRSVRSMPPLVCRIFRRPASTSWATLRLIGIQYGKTKLGRECRLQAFQARRAKSRSPLREKPQAAAREACNQNRSGCVNDKQ